MGWWDALVLAVVQGLTEFLPISSSGHLVVGGRLLDLPLAGPGRAAFFVLLHAASLLAVLVVMAGDLRGLWSHAARGRILAGVLLGCLPAGVAGIALKALGGATLFERPAVVGAAWVAMSLLLWRTRTREATGPEWTPFEAGGALRWRALLLVGLAQAFALVPGISRSGSTIAVALLLGMQGQAAFRFSFLMAIPLIAGATALEAGEIAHLAEAAAPATFALATAACFAVSLGALLLLRRLVHLGRLHWFAPYCLLAGLLTLFAL